MQFTDLHLPYSDPKVRVCRLYSLCQPHAELFGRECSLDQKYIINFGEEVVRGQPVFALSLLLATLEPMLRSTAGVASWSVTTRLPACMCLHCTEPAGRHVHQGFWPGSGAGISRPPRCAAWPAWLPRW